MKLIIKIIAVVIFLSVGIFAASYPPIKNTKEGLAISSNILANEIGQRVLDEGGNAIDAAVAVGYALAVVHPAAGNIGGGGFAVIHLKNGENITLDFREKAPIKATRDMYLDKNKEVIKDSSVIGYLAAGVPGTVAGMSEMLEKYGTKKLSDLIKPAINLAQNGFAITERQAQTMLEVKNEFAKFSSSKKYFLKKDGSTYKEGEILVQKDLAKTLKEIQKNGQKAFYEGKIADLIVKDMQKNGGIITKEDLKSYKPIWRKPVVGNYRGYEIISMGPPSSGGIHIIEILNIIENANIKELGFGSSATISLMSEAMRQAYADRSEYLGDPDFIKVPTEQLIDKAYAKKIYNKIKPNKAISSDDVRPGLNIKESDNTTHYSIADKWGNYGLVGGDANAIEPNKRPLSSMSPTIILKDGKLFMIVGSPGGARIITTVLQVIVNVIDHKMDISEAVSAPRFHMQWLPDEIRIEKFGMPNDVKGNLEKMGYLVVTKPVMGDVNAIMIDNNIFYGSMDPRKEF